MKIIINSSSMVPIYEQIVDQVKAQIVAGDLKENDILPSVRGLAKDLKISALTVKKAYDNLEQDGFTVTVHGKGTYVAAANPERMREEQMRGVEAEGMVFCLNREGICLSMGAACNSKSVEPSHVVRALGLPEEYVRGCLRLSFGRGQSDEDCDVLAEAIRRFAALLRN